MRAYKTKSRFRPSIATMKDLGDKTTGMFESNKNDAEKLAAKKVAEAKHLAEEQTKKTTDAVQKTKSDADAVAKSTGKIMNLFLNLHRLTIASTPNSPRCCRQTPKNRPGYRRRRPEDRHRGRPEGQGRRRRRRQLGGQNQAHRQRGHQPWSEGG